MEREEKMLREKNHHTDVEKTYKGSFQVDQRYAPNMNIEGIHYTSHIVFTIHRIYTNQRI